MPSSNYFKNEQNKKNNPEQVGRKKQNDLVPYEEKKSSRQRSKQEQQLQKYNNKKFEHEDEEIDGQNSLVIDSSISYRVNELRKRFRQTLTYSIILVFFSATPISFLSLIFAFRAKTLLEKRQPDIAELNLDRAFSVNLFSMIIGALILLAIISLTYPQLRSELDKVSREFRPI